MRSFFLACLLTSTIAVGLAIASFSGYALWQHIQLHRLDSILAQLPTQIELPVISVNNQETMRTSLTASAVYLVERSTGAELFELNSRQPRFPASTVKLLTAIVARSLYDVDDKITIREEVFTQGSVTGFVYGEQLSIRSLLAALLLQSGNDAAFALANNVPGGYDAFIEAMNARAKEMGLHQSFFTNSSGLDDSRQRMSARDLALLGEAVLSDPLLSELVATKQLTIKDETGKYVHTLQNRNELIGAVAGVFGLKTGTTASAGENLVTAVRVAGREYILVVLGSSTRYQDTLKLIDMLEDTRWEARRPALSE